MFGNIVTDGTRIAEETGGYIVRFNLSSNKPRNVVLVQAISSSVASDAISTPSTKEALHDLLNANPNNVDIAFAQSGYDLDIFLRTAGFPYTNATEIGMRFYRNPLALTANTQSLDIPEKTRMLAKLLILQETYRSQNLPVPQPIKSGIASEITKLGYI